MPSATRNKETRHAEKKCRHRLYAWWQKKKNSDEKTTAWDVLYECGTLVLYVATILLLIAEAVWILLHTFSILFEPNFASDLPQVLGGIVLAIIILELGETVHEQIRERPRLSVNLVSNFLTIGIVSAIRHILVIGAQLSIPKGGSVVNHDALLRELLSNVALIVVLLLGVLVVHSPWLVRARQTDGALVPRT